MCLPLGPPGRPSHPLSTQQACQFPARPLSTITSPFPPPVGGQGMRPRGPAWGCPQGRQGGPGVQGWWPVTLRFPHQIHCHHSTSPPVCFWAAPRGSCGRQVGEHGEQMEPPQTVGALKDHGAYPLYITDETEVQRDEMHCLIPHLALGPSLYPGNIHQTPVRPKRSSGVGEKGGPALRWLSF